MKKILILSLLTLFILPLFAQKKPLDHTVYDGWQSIGERRISTDGNWILYNIDVQEGDGETVLQRTDNTWSRRYPRGYNLTFTSDGRYAIFRIRPPYADVRQARIRKKKPEEMPRGSMAIVRVGTDSILKIARVKSYKVPEQGGALIAVHLEKAAVDTARQSPLKKEGKEPADTIAKAIVTPASSLQERKKKRRDEAPTLDQQQYEETGTADAEGDEATANTQPEGTDLLIYNLSTGTKDSRSFVSDFLWSKNGKLLLIEGSPSRNKPGSQQTVSVWRSLESMTDTISRGASDFRNFAIDDEGRQVAFVAERDSSLKARTRFHKLWYWKNGQDSASCLVDRNAVGMPLNWGVSEHGLLSFSKSGNRLFFGTAPVRAPKDTTLIDIDLVKLDIWHYKDDYLQPQQLKNLDQELKRSFLAVYHIDQKRMVQLADADLPQVMQSNEGDGDLFLGQSDKASRISMQWEGRMRRDVYAVDVHTGSRREVAKGLNGFPQVSPKGRYFWWYDESARHYFTWAEGKKMNISARVKVPLYDERFDMPDDPNPYGAVRWIKDDEALLVNDRFDIWQLDPQDRKLPVCVTGCAGRRSGTVYRYLSTDPEERFLQPGQEMVLRTFQESTKVSGLAAIRLGEAKPPASFFSGNYAVGNLLKAKEAPVYIYSKETFSDPADLYATTDMKGEVRLSRINPQQENYRWGNAELFTWKAYDGKMATGILYKPENFDPQKKYPLIAYFYERLSDGLHSYIPPAPTPSRLNISFFVSRGYLVLAPDIIYSKGHPGRAAFDYVVSGVRAVVKKGWADSTRLGLQGQSWGGYQAAHIITRTPLFKAAWAGAPVANMTSAYGGIRWESGLNRQFQYEHSQSRIGATLWENPRLYIENSPLFHLPAVTTPLVMMANDADGAVPWYQGIELFTALRRLGKPVWMLNYNGEAHNLVERKNRKDIQIREQQFFDWLLKGEKPARWITEGVPATEKGREWGLGY